MAYGGGSYSSKAKMKEGGATAGTVVAAGVALVAVWGLCKLFGGKTVVVAAVGVPLVAWGLSKLFGGGKEKKEGGATVGTVVAAGVALVVVWGLCKLFGGKTVVVAAVGVPLVAWGLSKLFGGGKVKKEEGGATAVTVVAAAAGVALVGAWGLSKLLEGAGEEEKKKMMKAPGRDYYMPRKDFEKNPRAYFTDLRK